MKFLLATAMLFAVAAPAAANLVVNGDFEAAPAPNGAFVQYFGGNTFPGWTVTGNDVLVIDESYSEGSLVFNANGGSQNAVDLTGAGNTGLADGITQTVATTAGSTYNISFFVGNASPSGNNGGVYTLPSTVRLSLDGGPANAFTNSMNISNAISFRRFSFVYTATGATTLKFSNGTIGDNYAGLDDVSVSLVPEPATWALMIVGFGMTGVAQRLAARRRSGTLAA